MKTIMIIGLLLAAQTVFSQTETLKNWDIKHQDNITVYKPKDLKQGEIFFHMVFPPQKTNGIDKEELLTRFAKKVEKEIAGTQRAWNVQKAKHADFFTSKELVYQGKKRMFVFHLVNPSNDSVYIIQTVVDNDPTIIKKYIVQLPDIINDIENHSLKPKVESLTSKSKIQKNISNYKPKPIVAIVKPPKGLKEIRGTMEYGLQPGGTFGLTGKVVALFNDGSFTRELGEVFSKGTERSKAESPKIWGKWRWNKNKLELKDYEDEEFNKTHGNWVAEPGKIKHKLKGCYGNMTSSSGGLVGYGDIVKGQASSWCFNPNGRFVYGVTGYGQGIFDISTKVSDKSKRGNYRIDNYTAYFVFDDGTEIITAFCFLDDEKEHIAINGKRLMLNY